MHPKAYSLTFNRLVHEFMQVIHILTAFGHFMLNEEQIRFLYNHIPNYYLEIPGI